MYQDWKTLLEFSRPLFPAVVLASHSSGQHPMPSLRGGLASECCCRRMSPISGLHSASRIQALVKSKGQTLSLGLSAFTNLEKPSRNDRGLK